MKFYEVRGFYLICLNILSLFFTPHNYIFLSTQRERSFHWLCFWAFPVFTGCLFTLFKAEFKASFNPSLKLSKNIITGGSVPPRVHFFKHFFASEQCATYSWPSSGKIFSRSIHEMRFSLSTPIRSTCFLEYHECYQLFSISFSPRQTVMNRPLWHIPNLWLLSDRIGC